MLVCNNTEFIFNLLCKLISMGFYRLQTKVCEGYVLHVSVILSQGGLFQHALQVVSQHALQQVSRGVSRPTPKREVEGDLVQTHRQGEIEGVLSRGCLLRGVPALGGYPPWRLLLWVVCILLECILVPKFVLANWVKWANLENDHV